MKLSRCLSTQRHCPSKLIIHSIPILRNIVILRNVITFLSQANTYTHTYTRTHTYTNTHAHTHIRIHTHTYTRIHIEHTFTHTHTHTHMCMFMYVRVCVCVCACVCVCVCVCQPTTSTDFGKMQEFVHGWKRVIKEDVSTYKRKCPDKKCGFTWAIITVPPHIFEKVFRIFYYSM